MDSIEQFTTCQVQVCCVYNKVKNYKERSAVLKVEYEVNNHNSVGYNFYNAIKKLRRQLLKRVLEKEKQSSLHTFLRYKDLEDMLKVILISAQSPLGLVPMLYHIELKQRQILFIQTGSIGGVTIHYIVEKEKPSKKFIELNRLTGQYSFAECLGSDTQALYIPVLELEDASLKFPT